MSVRSTINGTVSQAAEWCGVNAWLRRRSRDRLLVLCYHGVVEAIPAGQEYLYRNAVPADLFDAQLAYLRDRFTPVSAEQVLGAIDGAALPPRAVFVTFDDGYRNNLTVAAPILARHGIPTMVAVTTSLVGTDQLLWPTEVDLRVLHWPERTIPTPTGQSIEVPSGDRAATAARVRGACKQLDDDARRAFVERLRAHDLPATDRDLVGFLDWDEVRTLHAQGIEIASHTVSHPILSRTDDARLAREASESRARIEGEIGAACRCFVYPNGGPADVSERTRAALEVAGYRAAFTLCGAANPRALPRLAIDRTSVPCHAPLSVWASHVSGLRSKLRKLL